jgi:putative MATE family efflux protein
MMMEFLLNATDYFWVGKLGTSAQDAITTSMIVIWTIFSLMSIISVGLTAIVARYVGAKDYDRVIYYVKQGSALAVILGMTVSAIGYWVTPDLFAFMHTSDRSAALGIPYLRLFFAAGIFFFLAEVGYAIFRAAGDTRTPTKVGVLVVLINLVLDPILIFGWGPIPRMGVVGASLASLIAIGIGMVIILSLMFSGRLGFRLAGLAKIAVSAREMFKIMKIGMPMAGHNLTFVLVYWFLIQIVHEYGEPAAAAMGVGNRVESFSYFLAYGFSIAASTMVGQNLGAKKPERAARCAWHTNLVAIGVTFPISILLITLPELIASIFTSDPQVLTIAADYLVILGISQMAMAVEIVMEGAFSGAGDTLPPMYIGLPGNILRIPVAYYLCFSLDIGINGVWWTLTITSVLKAVCLALWFKRGRWKLKKV